MVLFSGGVDSSLLAWALRGRPGVRLFTVGSVQSHDLGAAETAAESVGVPWEAAIVDLLEARAFRDRWSTMFEGLSRTEIEVQVALGLAVSRAPRGSLVCGQGADELFLGYAHFSALSARAATVRAEADLTDLLSTSWPLSQRLAKSVGRNVYAPYLTPGFIAAARAIPIELRLPQGSPKRIFREWAESRGLPTVLSRRPKKAFQYGSGVARFLREGPAHR